MGQFILRRSLASLIVLFLASIMVFLGIRALPGDPALVLAGESPDAATIAAIREQFGLDAPLPVQYANYVAQTFQGNLGISTKDRIPVADILVERLPVTLELTSLAILVGLAIGVSAGIASAVRRGRSTDYVATGLGLFGLSVPHFWLGLIAILVFAVKLRVLPASGFVGLGEDPVENVRRMVLPALVLGTGLSAVIMRQTRSALLGQLSADYVRTARSKGLSRSREIRHGLRNSLTTVVTVLGLQLGALISGAVVTEQIFVIPGFGKLTVDAVLSRNYPVIQGAVLVTVTGYVVVNLLVDITYAYLNPRLRLSGASE
ncbi:MULTISPECIES: ABC transporter permease [Micromonospora]|uniref:Peptide ABC transporter n=1 Tax=Micromonospora sicca TaxID=2202420 RepID=A0A317DR17_9ACTN|nr:MULTISPECIES: ABC transporter permease [unclassified Micromonospora]MBM0226735.1 ABC transporter permease [Micromonospora sp. ATA51]PWR15335.1 peptide ABC transporter [Micromonospora sp. 4G51]